MRILAGGFALALLSAVAVAQAPSSRPAAAKAVRKRTGSLAQVMRGIYFPNANLASETSR